MHCLGRLLSTQRVALGQDNEPSWPPRQAVHDGETSAPIHDQCAIKRVNHRCHPRCNTFPWLAIGVAVGIVETMLTGLVLQYDGQTRALGANMSPGAPCTAAHCKYLVDGPAHNCVHPWHVHSSRFLWVLSELENGRPKHWQAGRQHQHSTPQRHQPRSSFVSG